MIFVIMQEGDAYMLTQLQILDYMPGKNVESVIFINLNLSNLLFFDLTLKISDRLAW